MSYKTILVHLDKKSIAEHRVRIAANLAIAEDACLIGVAIDRYFNTDVSTGSHR